MIVPDLTAMPMETIQYNKNYTNCQQSMFLLMLNKNKLTKIYKISKIMSNDFARVLLVNELYKNKTVKC